MRVESDFFCCCFDIDINLDRSLKSKGTTKLEIVEGDGIVDRLYPSRRWVNLWYFRTTSTTYVSGRTSLSRLAMVATVTQRNNRPVEWIFDINVGRVSADHGRDCKKVRGRSIDNLSCSNRAWQYPAFKKLRRRKPELVRPLGNVFTTLSFALMFWSMSCYCGYLTWIGVIGGFSRLSKSKLFELKTPLSSGMNQAMKWSI